jgi:hypothetical protein
MKVDWIGERVTSEGRSEPTESLEVIIRFEIKYDLASYELTLPHYLEREMPYNPAIHQRRSIRLRDYDYTRAGAYFLTVCARGRQCLFGKIIDGTMYLNTYGELVTKWWDMIPGHFGNVELDVSIIMPNHMHGIIVLNDIVGAGLPRPAGRVSEILSTEAQPLSNAEDAETAPLHANVSVPDMSHHNGPDASSSERPSTLVKLLRISNTNRPKILTNCATQPERLSGNAIITTISSALKRL